MTVTLPRRAPERTARGGRGRARAVDRPAPAHARAGRAPRSPGPTARCPTSARTLTLRPEPGRTRVHRRGDVLLVPAADPGPALERWYRRAARAEIGPRLDAATRRAGTSYRGLTIRGQRTRWASCSTDGGMSFNWRLLLAPAEVLDYVVEHEVCHLEVDGPLAALLGPARVARARLARARRLAAALRLDARCSERAPGAAPRTGSRAPPGPRRGAGAGPSTPPPRRRRARRRPRARPARRARPAPRPAAAA